MPGDERGKRHHGAGSTKKEDPMSINLNEVARTLTLQEGKKVSLPIGQVKEVMRLTLRWLAYLPVVEADALLRRYKQRR
jgi:hypothetical protein